MTTLLHLIPSQADPQYGFLLLAPMLSAVATPCGELSEYGPDETVDGVVCGHCLDHRGVTVRHATPAHVRSCEAIRQDHLAQARAEIWAEGGYERWAEGGWDILGTYSYDPSDRCLI